ncbi:MAG TPA: hypothetical protein PK025_00970 [Spirochaetales bacterium]|nr:hypothetical protein [Spirochaetales bacterium]
MKKVRFGYGIALALIAILALTGCPKPTEPAVPQPNAKLSSLTLNGGGDFNTCIFPKCTELLGHRI